MPKYVQPGVYIEEVPVGPQPIEGVSTSVTAFIGASRTGPVGEPTLVNSWNEFNSVFGDFISSHEVYLAYAVKAFFDYGGQQAYIVRVADPGGGYDNLQEADYIGALDLLLKTDGISILAIPGQTNHKIQQAMITHCEKVGYCFAVLDSEPGVDVNAVIAHRKSLISGKGFAAMYYPWIKVTDPVSHQTVFIPPSGAAAGIYARTDSERGVHKAPANQAIAGVVALEHNITKTEQNDLNENGVCAIRFFQGRGYLVWGSRTLAKNAEWKYINVRRMVMYLEESIEKGTAWAVFEPNDDRLWAKVKFTVTEFLTRVWQNGGLMGDKAEHAFYVKCDRTTMTQSDVNSGRLIIEIGVAAIRPAEFIVFRIAQFKGKL